MESSGANEPGRLLPTDGSVTTCTQVRRTTGVLGYNTAVASSSPSKVAVNQWLARLVAAAADGHQTPQQKQGPRWILALESDALTTFNTFVHSNVSDDHSAGCCTGATAGTFVVPNPDAAVCAAVTLAGGISLPVTTHALFAELEAKTGPLYATLVARGWPGSFDFIWLDYCGTLDSKAGKRRKGDIMRVLRSGLLPPSAILAVTISERGGAQPYRHAAVDELLEHVSASASTLQRSPQPRLCGVACYTGVEIRSGRTPLSLCTAAWRLRSLIQ